MSKRPEKNKLPLTARLVIILFGGVGCYELIRSLVIVDVPNYASFGLVLFLAIVTAHTKVRLIGGSTLSLLTAVVLTALMMLGMEAAVLVGVCGVLVQCLFPRRRISPYNVAFNIGMITITIKIAGFGFQSTPDIFVGGLIASFIYYLGNSLYVSMIVSMTNRKSIFRLWHDNFLYTAPSFFIAGLLAAVAMRLVSAVHPVALIIVVPILYLSYYSYRVYLRSLEEEKKHAEEMAALYSSTLSTLVLAIDAKDRNTHGHIQRVQKYSRAIAEAMKLDETEIEAIATAALLHDIGKLAVPEHILSKKGPLTPEEMSKMRMHPQLGADIISNIKFPYPVADWILAHHERYDGTGYPNKLKGKDIPLA
ncbi:MAG: HD domain-containing protein, partial [Acidobacteria bacterium]|nr:HD domain-containing protein [Acidobacteriota bacterium]